MEADFRAVAIDCETTGLKPKDGHRIIELGAVEIVNRKLTGRTFEQRINPEREIDDGATHVHGIKSTDLVGMPLFAQVAKPFLDFVGKATIIGHNIAFDLKFLDHEYNKLDFSSLTTAVEFNFEKHVRDDPNRRSDVCTMQMMKQAFPGSKKSLDTLCDKLGIDRSERTEHGALLDAKLTALCWLALTRGNLDMFKEHKFEAPPIRRLNRTNRYCALPWPSNYIGPLKVIRATEEEIDEHIQTLGHLANDPFKVKKTVASREEIEASFGTGEVQEDGKGPSD